MRIRKFIALVGAVLILFGCLILYRMTDHALYPQDEVIKPFGEGNPIEISVDRNNKKSSILYQEPAPFPQRSKLISLKQLRNKTKPGVCHRPTFNSKADISMLEVYKELKFDNLDGGVWKQGWNIEYDQNRYSQRRKLRVFVVPHSHNDPGWLKTFEDYYSSQTRHILNNMVKQMSDDPKKRFIWAEMSFFSLWWDELSQEAQDKVKKLVDNNQLEFVTGGWVMNDEANSHFVSIIVQLTEGHQWLKSNLEYKPKSSWCIDPFGKSATMPFLLKKMNLENLLIQRVHYSVKKYLARTRNLEFRWRQLWDDSDETDLFTHMMPFFSYDVPHTCGPDPKICCQFDFRRLPGHGMSCPWKISPVLINRKNVAARAELLLDQYRKKAELYRSNVVLIPLGDDFRYDHVSEWNDQFDNYYKLFDYLNKKPNLNVEVQFGTLSDYFDAVRSEIAVDKLPALTGDFFTYADRDDHYWSGYFTSRPFHKAMDRTLMGYLRAAELIYSLAWGTNEKSTNNWLLAPETGFAKMLRDARRSLSLFQHHDGVAGTGRDYVMEDYLKKMVDGLHGCQHVIQQSVHVLLSQPQQAYNKDPEQVYYDVDYIQKQMYSLPEKKLIMLREGEVKQVVVYNTLTFAREEVVTVHVFQPYVKVTDANGEEILVQVSPFFSQTSVMDESRYEVSFIVKIPALALTTYTVSVTQPGHQSLKCVLSDVKLYNVPDQVQPSTGFENVASIEGVEFSLQNNHITAGFSDIGLLKSITFKKSGVSTPLHVDFIRYLARRSVERSGAYLFLPEGEASVVRVDTPVIRVIEGPVLSRVVVLVPNVKHTITLYNSVGCDSLGLDVQNVVDIREQTNYELAMKISSHISNGDVFYTDLNGFQMIKRKRFPKLPLQANYYPLPGMAYVEDDKLRMSVVTAQPLGAASLQEGQIEIMQDRRLSQDDNRGLGQGVVDNKPTITAFRLLIEEKTNCQERTPNVLSYSAYLSSQTMLNPLISLMWAGEVASDLRTTLTPVQEDLSTDISLVTLRTLDEETKPAVGLVFHRTLFDTCFDNNVEISQTNTDGVINFKTFLPGYFGNTLQKTSLSLVEEGDKIDRRELLNVCHMDFLSVLIER